MKYTALFFSIILIWSVQLSAQDIVIKVDVVKGSNSNKLESVTLTCTRGGNSCGQSSNPENFETEINPNETISWIGGLSDDGEQVEVVKVKIKRSSNGGKSKTLKADVYEKNGQGANLEATAVSSRPSNQDSLDEYVFWITIGTSNRRYKIDPKIRMRSNPS